MSNYVIRAAEPDELPMVMKTWMDSYRTSHSGGILSITPLEAPCGTCGAKVGYHYAAVMPLTLKAILARPGVRVLVAVNPRADASNNIHGYIVVEDGAQLPFYRPPKFELQLKAAEAPLVHYILVKKIYRGFGLAHALFKAAGVDERRFYYTCTTPSSESIRKAFTKAHKPFGGEWQPLSARFAKETSQIHDQGRKEAPVPEGAHAAPPDGIRRHHERR